MSRRRHRVPLIRYSPFPSRKTRRVIETSLNSVFRVSSHSVIVSVTSAIPKGFSLSVPLKMTSAISPPRRAFADVSPKTHRTASTTLDLPQPFGPTMPVTPSWNSKTVRCANDLKPRSSRDLRCMKNQEWMNRVSASYDRPSDQSSKEREKYKMLRKFSNITQQVVPPVDFTGFKQSYSHYTGTTLNQLAPLQHEADS